MDYFETQSLLQQGDWDCGVEVFRKLAGISREELLGYLPDAVNGMTPSQAEALLKMKGVAAVKYQGEEPYTLPCAHLIRRPPHHHWIYEDSTGIHDPDPAYICISPKLVKIAQYGQGKELTLSCIKSETNF